MSSLASEVRGMINELLGLDIESYCSLSTVEDDLSFVTKDGGLMTLIRAHGHRRVIGESELATLCEQLVTLLGSGLAGQYHTIDVVFISDPARTGQDIASMLAPSVRTAQRQGLDLEDIFQERMRHLPQFTAAESCYLVIWTSPAGLPRSVRRQEAREKRRRIKEKKLPGGFTRHNQNSYAVNGYLPDTHRSFVSTVLSDMAAFGFDLDALPVRQACQALRDLIDPEWTPKEDWSPVLPGDCPPQAETPEGYDHASCWLPALSHQLLPRDLHIHDYRTVQVGDRLYQPIAVDLPQLTEAQRFEWLFDRIRRERIPWRLQIRLEGNVGLWLMNKRAVSGLLYFAGHQNKLISKSVMALRKYLNSGGVAVRAQMALTSWVSLCQTLTQERNHLEELRARTAQLASYVQAWGTCTVREYTGHPIKGYFASLPGFSRHHIGTRYAAPLADLMRTVPLYRPASPWRRGPMLFRTRDGKLYPYQPGSSEQGLWNSLYYARPGSGKSVTMNANNLALILSSGFRKLPFVRIIDIGPSSEGLISLVQEALPPARRHEAQFYPMSNVDRFAVNTLDTQLGLRRPLPQERAFNISFISILATKPGDTEPPDGVADMIGLILDLAYDHYAEPGAPKRYTAHQDHRVDRAIEQHHIVTDSDTIWWEIVDALFQAGDVDNATRAQRYAVPILSDLVAIAQAPQVQDIYGGMHLIGTGESPIQLFNRIISAATREFPILAYPTRFDIGNARLASLDIANLCGDMTVIGQRQTAIAYMLARHILGRDIFLDEHSARYAPTLYQNHHRQRFDEAEAYPKKLCMDEKHRCGPIRPVNAQIVRDMREGRKNNVHVDLASQIMTDFTDEMIELASSVYIMEYGNDDIAEEARERFSLPPSAMALLRTYGNGPNAEGAPFLSSMKTKRGHIYQLLYLTNGPIEMWALATTAEDRYIRRKLYAQYGPKPARAALATLYPAGSVKAEIERRLDSSLDANLDKEDVMRGIIDDVSRFIEQDLAQRHPASETTPPTHLQVA